MYCEIDPQGGLLIVLASSKELFAPWPSENVSTSAEDDTIKACQSSSLTLPSSASLSGDKPVRTTQETPEVPPAKKRRSDKKKSGNIHMKVSSEKICKASPRFRAMLTGPWLEATTIYPDGLRHVEIEGFDRKAFLAVIKTIHGHKQETLSLPEIIDLEFVAKIAVVVDDLDCYTFHSRSVLYASPAYQALKADVKDLHNPYYVVSVKELEKYIEEGLRTDAPIVNCFNRKCPVNVCLRACGTLMTSIRLGMFDIDNGTKKRGRFH
ncbi:hypothetical protein GE09DRAFT_1293806 [Coniochaeta sp. 2T2.1]|nr:hypothetical protein GE09DRAFT_1293806 [Coniochaeta sp. 2T2.1]